MIDRTFILSNDHAYRQFQSYVTANWKAAVDLGIPIVCQLNEFHSKRTDGQNRKLHAMLGDIAEQVKWAGETMDVEDWKRLLVASVYGQKVIPAIGGEGFVVLNKRTSRMDKMELSEVIEALYKFGAEKGVVWTHDELATQA